MSRLSSSRRLECLSLESRELMSGTPLPVLLVIADQQHFFYREYNDTRNSILADGIGVVVAATTTNPSTPHANSGQGAGSGVVVPNLTLASVNADDYSAIAFVGGWGSSMYQYAFNDPNMDGVTDNYYQNTFYNGDANLNDGVIAPQKVIVNNLINEFLADGKYVAGVCHGTTVLAWARVNGVSPVAGKNVTVPLKDGTPAMRYNGVDRPGGYYWGQYDQMIAHGAFPNNVQGSIGTPGTTTDDVVVDGLIITGSDDWSAARFGEVIAERVLAAMPEENAAPTDITLSAATVAENAAANTPVGNLTTTDPDAGNTFTYTLVSGDGSADNASFTIVGNSLRTTASFNYETKNSYAVRVRTTDQDGLWFEEAFTISVGNVNETPTILALSANTIPENAAVATTIGNLTTTDPDSGNTFTYTLVSGTGSTDNAHFNIVGNVVRSAASFNYEAKSNYSIRVRTTDQGGLFTENTFAIGVTDENETPLNLLLSNALIEEDQPVGTAVGNLTATDPEAGVLSYSLVSSEGSTDNASFTVDGNILRSADIFNRELKNSYSIRVRASDPAGLAVETMFTITVTDANEAPTDLTLSGDTLVENTAIGSVVGTLSTTDPDTGNNFIYSLVTGDGSADNGSFAINGNSLRTATSVNFEVKNNYLIRVRTTDQGGLLFEKTFAINVNDANETPTNITLSNATVAENQAGGTVIGGLDTTDVDGGDSFAYTLTAGPGSADNAAFAIVDGALRTVGSFNFEARQNYSVRVRSTDAGGLFTEKAFAIAVTNENEAPFNLLLSNATVQEARPVGTAIGNLTAGDPEANVLTYSLVAGDGSTDNASFTIVGNVLRTAAIFEEAVQSSYSIRVRAADADGLFVESTFTITVTQVNDSPILNNLPTLMLPAVLKNATNPAGVAVSALLANASDAETPSTLGVAILKKYGIDGTWEYAASQDGPWSAVGVVSESSALLLSGTDYIRFKPGKNFAGYAGLGFQAWDGQIGTSGTKVNPQSNPIAFSMTWEKAWLPVGLGAAAKYDADGRWMLPATKEDTANPTATVAKSVLGFLPVLFGSNPNIGLAVTGSTGNGVWQMKVGAAWQPLGPVTEVSARLIKPTVSLRFVPAADWEGEATITYRAWNLQNGLTNTHANVLTQAGFSLDALTAVSHVGAVNDAPVLETSIARVFTTAPQSVGSLTAGAGDIDSTIAGIGVTRAVAKGGVWQYRLSGTGEWTKFPAVSAGSALALDPWAEVRFLPNPGVSIASGAFDYKAWDGSTGGESGGRKPATTTAFSKATETATFSMGNIAPSFKTGPEPVFPATVIGRKPVSLSLAALTNRMTDMDKGFLRGLAITGGTGNGTWDFSVDGGKTWDSIGDVSVSRLLLRNTDRVRFTPDAGWTGTASLTFAAWDRTTGVAGDRLGVSDSISADTLTANLMVKPAT